MESRAAVETALMNGTGILQEELAVTMILIA
jgi:hypothetical protein